MIQITKCKHGVDLTERHCNLCNTDVENTRYRAALEEIAECELGFEGQVARKALGISEPDEPTTGSNQESWGHHL